MNFPLHFPKRWCRTSKVTPECKQVHCLSGLRLYAKCDRREKLRIFCTVNLRCALFQCTFFPRWTWVAQAKTELCLQKCIISNFIQRSAEQCAAGCHVTQYLTVWTIDARVLFPNFTKHSLTFWLCGLKLVFERAVSPGRSVDLPQTVATHLEPSGRGADSMFCVLLLFNNTTKNCLHTTLNLPEDSRRKQQLQRTGNGGKTPQDTDCHSPEAYKHSLAQLWGALKLRQAQNKAGGMRFRFDFKVKDAQGNQEI